MAKKKNNTLLYVAGAIILYFILKKAQDAKKKKGEIIVDESRHVEFLPPTKARYQDQTSSENMVPYIDQEDYFKDRYAESLNSCTY